MEVYDANHISLCEPRARPAVRIHGSQVQLDARGVSTLVRVPMPADASSPVQQLPCTMLWIELVPSGAVAVLQQVDETWIYRLDCIRGNEKRRVKTDCFSKTLRAAVPGEIVA